MHIVAKPFFRSFICVAAIICSATTACFAANRVALVIGNGAYQHGSVLKNPANDAKLIADALSGAGFDVAKIVEADSATMTTALAKFKSALETAPEASLVYYAGHGVQVKANNYLIPTDADFSNLEEFSSKAINLQAVLTIMGQSKSNLNIVLLDASRNNPFSEEHTPDNRGLAGMFPPNGPFIISFAAAPGSVALDGDGDNSPYATAIAKMIRTPGISIDRAFSSVRRAVFEATGGKQIPWDSSSFGGEFRFQAEN